MKVKGTHYNPIDRLYGYFCFYLVVVVVAVFIIIGAACMIIMSDAVPMFTSLYEPQSLKRDSTRFYYKL